ncbi:MAG: TlpA disulfide reductase family protein [Bacteroidales bacterium]|nr:TlpA disulfide reductase family protein [Bacteroidales bacterium]
MKKIFIMLAASACLCACSGNKQAANNEQQVTDEPLYVDSLALNHPEYLPTLALGEMAPEISAPDTLGNTINLSDYRGKYVVIDFWATWCGDCRREVPELKQVFSEFEGKQIQGAGIQFLSYSFDRDAERWKSFLAKEQFAWPQISTLEPEWKKNPASQNYGLNWIPAFLLVSPDGRLVGKAITAAGLRQVIKDEAKK